MDASSVLAVRALGVSTDKCLAQSLVTAEVRLLRERATVELLVAQLVRLQSMLRHVRRHLLVGDTPAAQDLLWSLGDDLGSDSEVSAEED